MAYSLHAGLPSACHTANACPTGASALYACGTLTPALILIAAPIAHRATTMTSMPKHPTSHKPGARKKGTGKDAPKSTARHDQTRTQRGYDNNWLRLSRLCLAEEPYCRYCARNGRVTLAEVSDHIIPIRIRPDLRLVRDNIQSLCKLCHDSVKAREENELYGVAGQ